METITYKIEKTDKLIKINKELIFQIDENEKKEKELLISNNKLKKAKEILKTYKQGLEIIITMVSHKVRQPVAHIMGLSNMLKQAIHSSLEQKKIADYMKRSVLSLDVVTKELTTFINRLRKKGNKKNV